MGPNISRRSTFGTTLLKTTNGGIDWIKIDSLFQLKFMSCIYFADDQTGWIGGTGISKTTNGGLTWQECLIDSGAYSNYPVYDLNFLIKTLVMLAVVGLMLLV